MNNDDLTGEWYTDTWEPPTVKWVVTGPAAAPGYVNLTRTSLRTGATQQTCQPANLVRARLKERGSKKDTA